MTRKYKTRKRGERSLVSVHLYIDRELMDVYRAIPNKTRFINDALAAYKKNINDVAQFADIS